MSRLREAPIGTKAPAIGGGHWTKTTSGWKWGQHGSTFPTVGGDWSGTLTYLGTHPTTPARGSDE